MVVPVLKWISHTSLETFPILPNTPTRVRGRDNQHELMNHFEMFVLGITILFCWETPKVCLRSLVISEMVWFAVVYLPTWPVSERARWIHHNILGIEFKTFKNQCHSFMISELFSKLFHLQSLTNKFPFVFCLFHFEIFS